MCDLCVEMTIRPLYVKLSGFHNTCIRKIMRIIWPRKITNEDLYASLKCTDMETILLIVLRRLRWPDRNDNPGGLVKGKKCV